MCSGVTPRRRTSAVTRREYRAEGRSPSKPALPSRGLSSPAALAALSVPHGRTEAMSQDADPQQLLLAPETVRRAARPRAPRPAPGPAAVDPVAQVLVDVPLAHLDRPFEYTVPEPMADAAVPGARVRVRFAGQERDGFVLARCPEAEHPGRLAPLRRVVSPEPVLSPQLRRLCREVTDRWAGTLPDVLRLAVPPRHAEAEKVPAGEPVPVPGRPE